MAVEVVMPKVGPEYGSCVGWVEQQNPTNKLNLGR